MGGARGPRRSGGVSTGLYESGFVGEYDGLDAVSQFEFCEEVADVGLSRPASPSLALACTYIRALL